MAELTIGGLKKEVIHFIGNAAHDNSVEKVILFGSRATGTNALRSDIDLAVRGGNVRGFQEALDEHSPTLLMFDYIDLSDDISRQLRDRISKEGITLYG